MSEQDNVEIVRRLYQLMNDGDLPAVLELVDDDVELFLFGSARVPWAGHWRGRDGVARFAQAMAGAAEVKDYPELVVGAGDSVIAVHRPQVRIRATGRDASFNVVHVLNFRNGKIIRFREYADTAGWESAFDALDA
ncbi:MAG TPA: nuclear transport factor 2 family protein [Candidatus Binataceae bacterium]|nr:nuclear transport factor 2 family protein [Candidatus Binataceae bacterium]